MKRHYTVSLHVTREGRLGVWAETPEEAARVAAETMRICHLDVVRVEKMGTWLTGEGSRHADQP